MQILRTNILDGFMLSFVYIFWGLIWMIPWFKSIALSVEIICLYEDCLLAQLGFVSASV
jgi:hypothetical protein